MKWCPITRRHFLQGAGNAVLALPLLPSLLSRQALAQLMSTPVQKTFVGIKAANGLFEALGPNSLLMPKLPLNLSPNPGLAVRTQVGRHSVHAGALTSLMQDGKISQLINESYNSLLPKMNMMQGFDYVPLASFHHNAHFGNQWDVAGSGGRVPIAPSIDQIMAYSTNFYKNPALRGRSVAYTACELEQGFGGAGQFGGPSATFKDPSNPLTSEIVSTPAFASPLALWERFFGSGTIKTPLKATLVDRILADYKSVRTNPRLGAADRQMLDNHISFMQETQRQVASVAGACATPSRPPDNAPSGTYWGAGIYARNGIPCTYEDRVQLLLTMNSVITAIVACGLCHSFLSQANFIITHTPGDDYHQWSHDGWNNDENKVNNQASYDLLLKHNNDVLRLQCLDLAKKLDAIKPDGVTSLLDNSLIMWLQEHSKRGHESWNVPVITWGSAGGAIKTGQYIDYRDVQSTYRDDRVFTRFGFPINQLWANIMKAVGVPPSEFEAYNKMTATHPYFVVNGRLTGYGATAGGDPAHDLMKYYSEGWKNHDLSGWLPFFTPTS
jgi:hypothetical protein